jgi:NADPH:quinone reductase
MKAVVVAKSVGADGLEVREVPAPEVKVGEVLVDVAAVGVNFADVLGAMGKYPGGPEPPYVCGREFAGEVATTGERVMGYAQLGACAEQVASSNNMLWAWPKQWSATEAAAFPVNYFTAWMCYWKAGLILGIASDGSPIGMAKPVRALIHGAAGGVGTAGVQLGKIFGVEVFGTSSSDEKLERLKPYGLTYGINYKNDDYEARVQEITSGEGVDIVFDSLAGEHTAKSLRCCRQYGRVMMYGNNSGERPRLDTGALYARCLSVHGIWLSKLSLDTVLIKTALDSMMPFIESGALKPIVGEVHPMGQTADAFRSLTERKNFGKVVVAVRDQDSGASRS